MRFQDHVERKLLIVEDLPLEFQIHARVGFLSFAVERRLDCFVIVFVGNGVRIQFHDHVFVEKREDVRPREYISFVQIAIGAGDAGEIDKDAFRLAGLLAVGPRLGDRSGQIAGVGHLFVEQAIGQQERIDPGIDGAVGPLRDAAAAHFVQRRHQVGCIQC